MLYNFIVFESPPAAARGVVAPDSAVLASRPWSLRQPRGWIISRATRPRPIEGPGVQRLPDAGPAGRVPWSLESEAVLSLKYEAVHVIPPDWLC